MISLPARVVVLCGVLSCSASALAREVPVSEARGLVAALGAARAGDVIVLSAGRYPLTGVSCTAMGTASEPIVVKSATPLAAKVELDALEGFKVTGAHWHFEGLDVTGVCARDEDCEHAFHVTGDAVGFVLRTSRVRDFNAQLKVNSAQVAGTWRTPHGGLVEGNEIADSHARNTGNPVTKLNIDTGDGWVVRANYLHDAHKAGGDNISYAAFMKSGGRNGVFERNLVICSRDDTTGGTRIGLSFGGGGTGPQFCAPAFDANTPCDPEHLGGTMRNNIVIGCSDVGIYLNKARDTKLLFNTLIATNGIDFRYASSTGEADGNVLAGKIRVREGGTFTNKTNLTDVTTFASWYVSPATGDLTKKGDLSALLGKAEPRADVANDYCGRPRPFTKLTLGALEHSLGDCDTTRPPIGSAGLEDGGASGTTPDAATESPRDGGSTTRDDAGVGSEPERDAMAEPSRDAGVSTRGGGDGGCSTSSTSDGRCWILLALALLLRRRTSIKAH